MGTLLNRRRYMGGVGEQPWVDDGYLTFEAIDDCVFKFRITSNVTTTDYQDISFSTDQKTWTTLTNVNGSTLEFSTPTIKAGKKVMWKGNGVNTAISTSHFCKFSSTGRFNAYGSIFSIIQGDNFKTGDHTTLGNLGFLFQEANIVDASDMLIEATTVTSMQQMFENCTYLTTSPVLTPLTVPRYGYYRMFKGCSSLNYITMLATNVGSFYALQDWVDGVSATGTFVKNPNATWTNSGKSGIPTGWSVETYSG